MRLSTGQYAIRVFCGLGLLLLPAVQQKVCTWPARSDTRLHKPAQPAPTPTSDDQPKRKTKRPLTLAALLPDVAPPRWPNHTHLNDVQRVRPLPVTGWTNDPGLSSGPPVGESGGDGIITGGWPKLPAPQRLHLFADGGNGLVRTSRHVFFTTILRTGPPRA